VAEDEQATLARLQQRRVELLAEAAKAVENDDPVGNTTTLATAASSPALGLPITGGRAG